MRHIPGWEKLTLERSSSRVRASLYFLR